MPKRLEFVSHSITARDPQQLVLAIRRKYPTWSDQSVLQVAERELWKVKPRLNHTCVYLFGVDIFTDDLTTLDAWPHMDPKGRRYLQRHQDAGTLATIVSIAGLSTTYAFTRANQWTQEVDDRDLPLIRGSKAKHWFRDVDTYGPFPGFKRAWELPVVEREAFTNLEDAARFAKDVRKKKTWAGS